MSCKYCRGNKKNKRLMSTDCDEINFDIYIGANSPILVALGSNFIDTSEVEINFCPMWWGHSSNASHQPKRTPTRGRHGILSVKMV